MRRSAVLALLAVLLAGCGGDPAPPSPATPSTAPADAVFTETMDSTAPGWQDGFAVEGADASEAEAVAILAAKTACTRLMEMPIEQVLLSFLAGELPPETAGTLVYAATVAYCPEFTDAVQNYAAENR